MRYHPATNVVVAFTRTRPQVIIDGILCPNTDGRLYGRNAADTSIPGKQAAGKEAKRARSEKEVATNLHHSQCLTARAVLGSLFNPSNLLETSTSACVDYFGGIACRRPQCSRNHTDDHLQLMDRRMSLLSYLPVKVQSLISAT